MSDLNLENIVGFKAVDKNGLKMLGHYQFGGILADEMGLGKTLQTIAFLLSEKEERESFSALIVAPASCWQSSHREHREARLFYGNKAKCSEYFENVHCQSIWIGEENRLLLLIVQPTYKLKQ